MKMHLRTAILAALVAAAAATASAQPSATTATQPGPGWSALKSYTGTIVQVDPTARLVTTRDAGGQTLVFEAPPALASSQLAGFQPGDRRKPHGRRSRAKPARHAFGYVWKRQHH